MPGTVMNMGTEYTIDQFSNKYKADDFTFGTLFYKEVIEEDPLRAGSNKLILNSDGILDRYYRELEKYKVWYSLDNRQYMRYRLNPKLLSYDLYGTTELWFLILHANEMVSVGEFDKKSFYIYNVSVVRAITRMKDLERNYINYNEAEKDKMLK